MNIEKLNKLIKYQALLKDRKASPIPAKQSNRPKQFLQFLDNELATVAKQIEALKLVGGGK